MSGTIDEPLVISAAITGGGPARKRTPYHPVTHDELVQEAVACGKAGAAIVHLHARNEDGIATMSPDVYRNLANDIRAEGSNVIINFSAGDNGGRASHTERLGIAKTGAEMVTIGAGSFNANGRLYNNAPNYIDAMLKSLSDHNVSPEIEIFDTGQLAEMKRLMANRLISPSPSVQFVFGVSGGLPARIGILDQLLLDLPADCHWSTCCQSDDYSVWREMMLYTFLRGGHIRTGMEDVIYAGPGELAKSNADLVAQWVKTAQTWGRPLVTPDELRAQLGICH